MGGSYGIVIFRLQVIIKISHYGHRFLSKGSITPLDIQSFIKFKYLGNCFAVTETVKVELQHGSGNVVRFHIAYGSRKLFAYPGSKFFQFLLEFLRRIRARLIKEILYVLLIFIRWLIGVYKFYRIWNFFRFRIYFFF